MLIQIRIK